MKAHVVIGTLGDWPLATRLAKLAGLPREALAISCYHALGTKKDVAAASKAFFRRKETIAPSISPHERTILAILDACTDDRNYEGETSWGFHGSATLAELRTDLAESFAPMAPGEALAARRSKPAASIAATTKALADRSIPQRKTLLAYLAGGPLRESLLNIEGHDLSYGFAAGAECFGEVDRRLLFLWARCATAHTMFPLTAGTWWPEAGFDRRAAYVQELAGVGVPPDLALEYVVFRQAQHSRWWRSTGVWVWEQLVADRAAFLERARKAPRGEILLGNVLMAMAWLPGDLLAAGGRELLREVCGSPTIVPDRALFELLSDEEAREAIGPLARTPREGKGDERVVFVTKSATLAPFAGERESDAQLAAIGATLGAQPAKAQRVPSAAELAKSARAAAQRAKAVEATVRELLRRSPSKKRAVPASEAQLASLKKLMGGALPPELRAYFVAAANLYDALETPGGVDGPLLSLVDAMRVAKELRTYDAPDTLLPFSTDEAGNYACFDVETSKVVDWDHETRGTHDIHPDLATALDRLWLRRLRPAAKPKKTSAKSQR